MWLTDVAIRRPVFITMFVLALVIMGFLAKKDMPAELYPDIDFPFVTITTTYPGAGPQEIETLVTEPIERAVSSIGNIRHVTSTSQDGVSSVGMEFEIGTNLDEATADVRDKVSAVRRELPRDLEPPTVSKADISARPIVTIGMTGLLSNKQMRILADDVIKDRLSKVGGVAGVYVSGGDEREVLVSVDRDRLQAYGATINDVSNALMDANLNLPSGSIKEDTREYAVRTVGEFKNAEEIRDLRINIGDGDGSIVRLGDIATIKDTIADPDVFTRLNGKDSVVMAVLKQSDANTVDVAEGVKEELKNLQQIIPTGVKPVIATDESVFVEDSLHDVNESLLVGIVLVVIIVFLFLHSARATFIVAIAIPTSLFATFLPISRAGFSMNMMTMLALSLAVGILVDDSIVILENIERHLRMGESPNDAALNGRSEIGLAAITITMVDVVVFVPIAFMGGIVGQFFKQFGITIATATMFSLLMSFTLTPMMAARWMSAKDVELSEEEEERRLRGNGRPIARINGAASRMFRRLEAFYGGLDTRYRGLLVWALENRFLIVVIGFVSLLVVFALTMSPVKFAIPPAKDSLGRLVIAFIALLLSAIAIRTQKAKGVALIFGLITVYLALFIVFPSKNEFLPTIDEGTFAVLLEAPAGSSLKATDAVTRWIETELAKLPEMDYYLSTVGSTSAASIAGAGNTGSQYGRISVKLVDKTKRTRSVQQIVDDMTEKVALIPGADIRVTAEEGFGPSGSTIAMEITGADTDEMVAVSNRIAEKMSKVIGVVDLDVSWKIGKPEAQVTVDRIRAADMDMSVQEIASALRTSIAGNTDAKLRDSGTEYDIRVQLANVDRESVSDVSSIIVGHGDGSSIYLRDVADVKVAAAPVKIDRKDRQRIVYVGANLASGYALGNVQSQIDKAVAETHLGSTHLEVGGTAKVQRESFSYMGSALILAILLVYMLMAALFESLATPLIIMFALPQAMVGALLALIVTNNTLSIISMIGIIMLTGLVTKNAILLVDYTNTLRSRGKSRYEAILESGPTRLRPILMTTFAMVFGMLPTALAVSRGSEQRSPMAIAVIGGLVVSTLLTLIVIPVVYTIVDDWVSGARRRLHRLFHGRDEEIKSMAPELPTEEVFSQPGDF